jgi:hypothetical protein
VKSDGWTVIRNQQTNDISSAINVASASTTAASVPKEIPKAAAAPSVWGTFLEEEEDIDMLSLLAARDASLALSQKKENKLVPTVKKEKVVEKINASVNQSESESDHLRTPLLPRALACWKIDAICDPCPYGSDILIHAALHGEEEEEERSAQSYEAMQHVQQMLAGYIAASEAEEEGDGDQGRDDPALLALLKSEMTITKNTHSREKEKEKGTERGAEKEGGKSGANITNNSSSSSSKREGHGVKYEHDKSEEGERDGDTSMLNKSDCRSRVESSFQAAVSHAPSQVARLYHTIFLFYSVLFCSILFCSILFYSIYTILFYFVPFCSILFYSILRCPILSHMILFCFILFYFILSCPALSHPILPYSFCSVRGGSVCTWGISLLSFSFFCSLPLPSLSDFFLLLRLTSSLPPLPLPFYYPHSLPSLLLLPLPRFTSSPPRLSGLHTGDPLSGVHILHQ